MRCLNCDGTGYSPWTLYSTAEDEAKPCNRCEGTGIGPDDEFEEKIREAVAKIGMVYFVRDDINGRLKIGTALNPLTRLRNLQTGSSVPLRLIAMFPGGRKGEQELHGTWSDRRLEGEWFDDRDRGISNIILYTARSDDAIMWPNP